MWIKQNMIFKFRQREFGLYIFGIQKNCFCTQIQNWKKKEKKSEICTESFNLSEYLTHSFASKSTKFDISFHAVDCICLLEQSLLDKSNKNGYFETSSAIAFFISFSVFFFIFIQNARNQIIYISNDSRRSQFVLTDLFITPILKCIIIIYKIYILIRCDTNKQQILLFINIEL